MTAFASDFASATADHLTWFGQVATYTEPNRDPVTVTVSVGREQVDENQDGPMRRLAAIREVRIPRDATLATGGVADPKPNATITIDGVRHAIVDRQPHAGQTETWTTVRVRRAPASRIERDTLHRG